MLLATDKDSQMLRIDPVVLLDIAAANGWVHERGRLAGTVNAAQMAAGLGVATSTITRAYDEGACGLKLLDLLQTRSGLAIDDLLIRVDDQAAESSTRQSVAA